MPKIPTMGAMGNRRRIVTLSAGMLASAVTVALVAVPLAHMFGISFPSGLEVIAPTPHCPGPSDSPLSVEAGQPLGAPSIAPRNQCTPSFTVQDVLDYEHAHPFGNMRMASIGHPKVTKVLFITSAQASQRLGGESIGLADDALVCFVELDGAYRFSPPLGAGDVREHTGTMHEIFDAHTGNLIISGG